MTKAYRNHRSAGGRGAFPRLLRILLFGALLVPLLGCRGTEPEGESAADGLQLLVDIVPLILRADTTETATVWVTVFEEGLPIADSTRVNLVTTLGSISAEIYTYDGLATATYTAAAETGSAAIIAQVRGVRDTIAVTLY